jgi:UDP:flavonoid glycosyltransferase YjiC (YdhE family)
VRVLERFPLSLLLPSCAAVVHHGGAGSAMTSMWAGVPQLLVTFAPEQTVSGTRIAAAGAGVHLLGHQADRSTLRDAVAALVGDPGYRTQAAGLRRELLSRPSPAELVATLEKLS